MLQFEFLVSSHFEFEGDVTTWVNEFCQNLSLWVSSQIVFNTNCFITKLFQHNNFFNLSFPFFTINFVHHKAPWPLRPHSGKNPPGQYPFSSPCSPSDLHDKVCSLKISTVCSGSPAFVDDMIVSNIFYWVLHSCDSV